MKQRNIEKKSPSIQRPGKKNDAASYIDPGYEATTAAYLGHTDVADLRMFAMSAYVLPF